MDERSPILILTASAGTGHTVAARALEEAFRRAAPQATVEVHDVLQSANTFFRNLYGGGYLGLVRHWPAAFGLIYDVTDRPARNVRRNLRRWFQTINMGSTMRFIERRRPRLIVNTHFLSAEIVAQMIRAKRLACPQVTVTTDFETHRLWAQDPTRRYYTATDEGREYLRACGAPESDILLSGIPVRAAFAEVVERDDARHRLGLALDAPVVLLLCGGFGVGPIEQLLAALLDMPAAAQLVVIAGRNEALRARLERRAQASQRSARIVGFTDEMHVWMRAADLVVTKPGGLTVAESLACGVPMVIVNPIPGQESRNSDFLLENRAAIKVNNAQLLGFRVGRLLGDAPRLAAMRCAALKLARPDAATNIVGDALRLLG